MATTEDYMRLNAQFCAPTHAPIPVAFCRAQGARMWDVEGKEYIDFLSAFSVVNQGHRHPKIVKAMTEQCEKISICTSAFQNEAYPVLCKKLCELLGYDLAASMSSGSEAVDLAIKIARKWAYEIKGVQPDAAKILTLTGNYHGKTLSPLAASSNSMFRDGFGPFLPNVGPSVAGFPVRFNEIEDIKAAFEASGKELAAVMVECVQGYGGCLPADHSYLQAVADLCREYNVLFIADEIQSGFGRTGALMSYQPAGIKPDMVIIAKALTGGMYPMSMVLGHRTVMTQIKPGQHSSTFAGNPLASAVAMAAIDVVVSEGLPERACRLGNEVKERLQLLRSPHVTFRVTGRGLLLALHINESPSHATGRVTAERLGKLLMKRGIATVHVANRVRISPPLVIPEDELWKGVEIIEKAVSDLADLGEIS